MEPWQRFLREAAGYLDLNMPIEAAECLNRLPLAKRGHFEAVALKFQLAASKFNWWHIDCATGQIDKIDPTAPEWWIAAANTARTIGSESENEIILRMGLVIHKENPNLLLSLAQSRNRSHSPIFPMA